MRTKLGFVALSAGIFFMLFICPGFSQEPAVKQDSVDKLEEGKQNKAVLQEVLKLKQQMAQIAKNTIENDQELKAQRDKIRDLSQVLREALKEKLDNNPAYQNLKQKATAILERLQKEADSQKKEAQ